MRQAGLAGRPPAAAAAPDHRRRPGGRRRAEPGTARLQPPGPRPDVVGRYHVCPTEEGWLYLAAVLDAFSRKVVGWAMADHLRTELVPDALELALAPAARPRALHHSDRGCQYTPWPSADSSAGLVPSMSRTANATTTPSPRASSPPSRRNRSTAEQPDPPGRRPPVPLRVPRGVSITASGCTAPPWATSALPAYEAAHQATPAAAVA